MVKFYCFFFQNFFRGVLGFVFRFVGGFCVCVFVLNNKPQNNNKKPTNNNSKTHRMFSRCKKRFKPSIGYAYHNKAEEKKNKAKTGGTYQMDMKKWKLFSNRKCIFIQRIIVSQEWQSHFYYFKRSRFIHKVPFIHVICICNMLLSEPLIYQWTANFSCSNCNRILPAPPTPSVPSVDFNTRGDNPAPWFITSFCLWSFPGITEVELQEWNWLIFFLCIIYRNIVTRCLIHFTINPGIKMRWCMTLSVF